MNKMQLGLRAKLFVMASVTIVAVGAVAGVYFVLAGQIDRSSEAAARAADRLDRLSTAQVDALTLLNATGQFFASPSEERVAAIAADSVALAEHLPGLDDLPDVQAALQSMPGTANAGVESQTSLGLDIESGLQGSLRKSVRGVEDLLNAQIKAGVNLDGLMTQMLMLRRHEKDFMLRRDPKYITSFNDALVTFDGKLKSSALPADLQTQVAAAIATYDADFQKFATGFLALGDAQAAFETDVADASAIIETQLAAAEASGAAAEAELTGLRASMSTTLVATFGIAIVLALVIAFLVSRAISRPIVGMTRAMGRLAAGISPSTSRPATSATRSAPWPRRWRCSSRTPSASANWGPRKQHASPRPPNGPKRAAC